MTEHGYGYCEVRTASLNVIQDNFLKSADNLLYF